MIYTLNFLPLCFMFLAYRLRVLLTQLREALGPLVERTQKFSDGWDRAPPPSDLPSCMDNCFPTAVLCRCETVCVYLCVYMFVSVCV